DAQQAHDSGRVPGQGPGKRRRGVEGRLDKEVPSRLSPSAVHHRRYFFIVPFLAPAVVLYATFVLWPYAESFYVALTDWKGLSARRSFVGLTNFVTLVHDPLFWNAASHNAELLVVLPIITLG